MLNRTWVLILIFSYALNAMEPEEQEDLEECSQILGSFYVDGIEVTRLQINDQIYRVTEYTTCMLIFRETDTRIGQTIIIDPETRALVLRAYHKKTSPRRHNKS